MPAEQYGREAKHLQLVQLQQAHYPSDPMQPGPIYFLTPRKCAMFGVCCESIPRQVFFLIDEAMNIGKGANAIMSMLHYYFKHHGSGKALWISMLTIAQAKIKTIHWFNICSGGSWQSSTSISHSHFSFLVRESELSWRYCQDGQVFDSECCTTRRHTGRTGNCAYVCDWAAYLSIHVRKLLRIKKYHHFQFSSERPGSVFTRTNAEAPETKVDLVPRDSWSPSCDQLPDQDYVHVNGICMKA